MMTAYAKALVQYAAQFGRLSEEEAEQRLDAWLDPSWRYRSTPPAAGTWVVSEMTDTDD
ncbi:hypothetical protein [Shewanella algae]|uniref:hypothetical protein n=1 Tax=Shewanella algae TaxID=38313 RepID=UPI001AAD68E2|nr:hypothetical protein [Shewanella algae]MBO2631137.1 hypothetical protein [Shewanella algae]MBO2681750.1 hypothetical protein [Shewanella algae]